jgi:hypothetical protein
VRPMMLRLVLALVIGLVTAVQAFADGGAGGE